MTAIRVLHVITDLDTGGAETMMARIIARSDSRQFQHCAVSLTTVGRIGESVRRAGVEIHALGMNWRMPNPLRLLTLRRLIARLKPDVIKSWLYHANLATAVAPREVPVVWGVHNLTPDDALLGVRTRLIGSLCANLSYSVPARVVYVSHAAAAAHARHSYDAAKSVVIPNGFDTGVFMPYDDAASALRRRLGLRDDAPMVGLVARFNPAKDHLTFLRAAALIREECPGVAFVLCGGTGITDRNPLLMQWIADFGLGDAVHLLGRQDMPALMPAFDVGVSSSVSEAFPLVVGELMASGVPCVVSDVGDTRLLAGDAATVVPPRDPRALADGCLALLRLPAEERRRRGLSGRQRIVDHFTIEAATTAYERVFCDAVRSAGRAH